MTMKRLILILVLVLAWSTLSSPSSAAATFQRQYTQGGASRAAASFQRRHCGDFWWVCLSANWTGYPQCNGPWGNRRGHIQWNCYGWEEKERWIDVHVIYCRENEHVDPYGSITWWRQHC